MPVQNYAQHEVKVPAGTVTLDGEMIIPSTAKGIALFAHVSGSSRHSFGKIVERPLVVGGEVKARQIIPLIRWII